MKKDDQDSNDKENDDGMDNDMDQNDDMHGGNDLKIIINLSKL